MEEMDRDDMIDALEYLAQDNEMLESWLQVNWRIVKHNHTDVLHHDTCGLCVLEWALYGGLR